MEKSPKRKRDFKRNEFDCSDTIEPLFKTNPLEMKLCDIRENEGVFAQSEIVRGESKSNGPRTRRAGGDVPFATIDACEFRTHKRNLERKGLVAMINEPKTSVRCAVKRSRLEGVRRRRK